MDIHSAWKKILSAIPGTRANLGVAKREMERTLRSAGYSKAEACQIVSRYFEAKHDA